MIQNLAQKYMGIGGIDSTTGGPSAKTSQMDLLLPHGEAALLPNDASDTLSDWRLKMWAGLLLLMFGGLASG